MPWELKNDRPIYLQLIEQIGQRILSGIYPPGSKLPSVRDLATSAAVNPNTMQKALSELERSGLINTNRTSGRFITEDTVMLQDMKRELAMSQLKLFLEHLAALGLEKKEIQELLLNAANEQSA